MIPATVHAFLCGALLIVAIVSAIRNEPWGYAVVFCIVNGLFAWVI